MTGPFPLDKARVMNGTFGSASGCNRFQRSTSSPSRRSSVKLVTLHTSLLTPCSAASISAAASTSRRIAPAPKRRTLKAGLPGL